MFYDEAFQKGEGKYTDYYNAACSWALAGDSKKGFEYLNKAVELGWKNVDHLLSDPDLESLHDTKDWESIVGIAEKNKQEYEKDMNIPLKEQLEDIMIKDQALRGFYQIAQEKYGKDSKQMKYFWSLMAREDSLNTIDVVDIIEGNGWPGKSEVGGMANTAVWLVIQHADLELQEKYLPMLKASVKEGESNGSHLALLEDRIRMRNDKPQLYGSQYYFNKETEQNEFFQISDPEKVNERRAEVGLGPIEDYAERNSIKWPIQ